MSCWRKNLLYGIYFTFYNNTLFSTIIYTFSMWRFRKGGLHSCFLIYDIFLNCLGYGVEWGAGLWMINFEGLKGRGRDLAEGDSPSVYLRTFRTGIRIAKNHHITTFGKQPLTRAAHVYTHCCFHRAFQMLFRFPMKQEFCTRTNDLQTSRHFWRLG